MSILMVKTPGGQFRRVELSKRQPLTIGSHSVSDLQIEDPEIGLMEARVSWGKQHYEVTAATPKGVKVNGETVMAADLTPGDILTLGQTDLIFTTPELLEETLAGLKDSDLSDSLSMDTETYIGLMPISEEIPTWNPSDLEDPIPPERPDSPVSMPPEEDSSAPYEIAKHSESTTDEPPDLESLDWGEADSRDEGKDVPMLKRGTGSELSPEGESASAPVMDTTSSLEKIRESLHASRQRPGEKEIFRSPLVMGLSIVSFFLLVGAIILWSVIGQEEADRYLERAREQAEQRKFQLAIEDYQTYLLEFPGDADVETAYRELSITRVRSQIDIGVPDWEAGLKELEELVNRHRDEPNFPQFHDQISKFAEQIAKGVCDQAGREGNSDLFELSDSALRLVELYTDDEDHRDRILSEVGTARRAAEAQILRDSVFAAAYKQMETALEQSKPFELLDARLDLIRRYADAETDSQVKSFLQKALNLEQSLVQQNRVERAAVELPPLSDSPVTTLASSLRVSRNELPSGRPVYVRAADCLYGIDTATGEPIWRHVTGWEMPFFPIEVSLGEPALLLFSDRQKELQLLSRETGKPIWRQSLPKRAVGKPLIVGTQAFLSTEGGQLQQVDLSTGTILASLSCSQPLATSPLLLPESQHGLLIGARDLAYLIELNPPAVVEVLYLGHGSGAIATAPIRMGPLVLVIENDRADSVRLRVFDTRQKTPELVQTDEKRLPGRVIDAPVIRGKQLVIPSTPERITAFTVSAESEQPPLTQVSYFQVPNPRLTSTWITAGPAGQIWMASTALRRMHLTTESLEASSDVAAVGIATQPIQMLGDRLYVGRRPDFGQVVRFGRLDRNDFSGAWRTSVGDEILQRNLNGSGELITLHDSGAVFRLQKSSETARSLELDANADVEIPDLSVSERFTAKFDDGRLAMTWGGAEPKLSVIRTTGQIEREYELPAEPRAAPVDLDAGIVVALPGRLHLLANSRSKTEEFLLPVVEGKSAEWSSLTRLDGTHLLSVEGTGLLRRIEYRKEPLPHLAEAGNLDLKTTIVIPPLLTSPDRLLIATGEKQLLRVAADSLQILTSKTLDSAPTGAWNVGDSVSLQLQNGSLVSLADDDQFTEKWRISFSGQNVAGRPLEHEDNLIVPVAPEGVWILKQESGEIVSKVRSPGTCAGDPLLRDGIVVIPLADGSLFFLPDPTEGGQQL